MKPPGGPDGGPPGGGPAGPPKKPGGGGMLRGGPAIPSGGKAPMGKFGGKIPGGGALRGLLARPGGGIMGRPGGGTCGPPVCIQLGCICSSPGGPC